MPSDPRTIHNDDTVIRAGNERKPGDRMASKLKILVWEDVANADEEPMVDVTMPTYLAKWADRMMKLMPKKAREEMWGEGVDLGELNFAELIKEAVESGENEIMEVKVRDKESNKKMLVKIFLEE